MKELLSSEELEALDADKLVDYPEEGFKKLRGYIDVEIQNHRYSAFLDPGSDVSLISVNLIQHQWPNWKEEAPHAGDIEVNCFNQQAIPKTDARWLKLRLLQRGALSIPQKFVITDDKNKILIGNDAKC